MHRRLFLPDVENLVIQDYDEDGLKEIITQNSIRLGDSHIYIGSLYTVYRPENLRSGPDKIFMLDRYGIPSRLINEIIDNGSIKKGSWGSALTYWIETKYNNYTEKDIEKAVKEDKVIFFHFILKCCKMVLITAFKGEAYAV